MDKDLWLSKLWDEWLSSPVTSRKDADAETSGILMGMRHNHETFTTARFIAARRLTGPGKVRLWPLTSYAEKLTLGISMLTRPNRKTSVRFTCPPEILRHPAKNTLWPWLKGIWGSAGGLYFPKAGYHLAIIISDPEISRTTREMLKHTKLSWSERRNEFALRNHDDITTFLYRAGMESAALDFEGLTLIRSARNKANLASNYDTANIARSVKAAREQLMLARRIIEAGLFESLPEKLREVVELRVANPDASLDELGQKSNPPASKSTVKYRWNKLQSLIES
ncbi:MAG: DNA-binding protein WhiA [Synergistaceae bacterium]|nr:DNA-binding protein WhiA [Synergistaceae bacterium]